MSQESVAPLIDRMTLDEKVGQMTQVTLQALTLPSSGPGVRPALDPVRVDAVVVQTGVGSVLNVVDSALSPDDWRALIGELQDAAGRSRLGIPLVYGIDAMHGAGYTRGATVFPQSLAMAATWDPELVFRAASVTAAEMRACGIPWNFAPVLDVGRQPLWSRLVETYGEDVLLCSELGRAAVRGHADVEGVAACAKHFVGYSAPVTGQDRTTALLPDTLLREIYLPPFAAAIDAGVQTVMVNSGDVNGIPVHASRTLLTDVLRGALGFEGVVVTDWEDVVKLHTVHRVAPTLRDAVRMAVEAGIDMSMTPYDTAFATELAALVREGLVPESRIDASVRRILGLKHALGLFDVSVPDAVPGRAVGSPDHRALARRAARSALVLLENRDGTLPLESGRRVLLAGGAVRSRTMLLGSWTGTWQGTDEAFVPVHTPTIEEAWAGSAVVVATDPAAVSERAQDADVIVAVLGERPSVEKPGDRHDLDPDADERHLVEAALATGLPVVLVLLTDRPLRLGSLADRARAVVWAGRPGCEGARAIVDLLTGAAEPEGRLPFTWPRHPWPLLPYDHRWSDRLGRAYGLGPQVAFDAFDPAWPFGHGLSFTELKVESVSLARDVVAPGEPVDVLVDLANTGERLGRAVVQIHVRDCFASVAPPVERLRAFDSVWLQPGERVRHTVRFVSDDLAFETPDGRVLEPGAFEVRVGGHVVPLTVVDPA